MADYAASFRKKARFIVELRFPIAPKLFDVRGHIISSLEPHTKKQFPFWSSATGHVLFGARQGTAVDEFMVGSDLIAFRIEDPASLDQFTDMAVKYFKLALEVIGKEVTAIDRIGARVIGVHVDSSLVSFDSYVKRAQQKLLVPTELDLEPTDLFLRVRHANGAYAVGPIRRGEPWVHMMFQNPSSGVPEAGIGIDVDSAVTNLKYKSADDAVKAIRSTLELSLATEEALLRQVGIGA